jgi:CSLREA domain-containing protein
MNNPIKNICILLSCFSCQDNDLPVDPSITLIKYGIVTHEGASLVVNSTDDNDDGSCNAAHCSLREAIQAANAQTGMNRITFDIAGNGPHVISPMTIVLPVITDPVEIISIYEKVILDGVYLDGKICSAAGAGVHREYPGLDFNLGSDGSIVQGLSIKNFCIGIAVSDVDGLEIIDNTLEDNIGNASIDLLRSDNNLVKSNKLYQNQQVGDQIELFESNGNKIINNSTVGGEDGIELLFSHNNIVQGNSVSAPFRDGIFLYLASENRVVGNNVSDIMTSSPWGGILLLLSNLNTIESNKLENVRGLFGVFGIFSSHNNKYTRNTVSNAIASNGFMLLTSRENEITKNDFKRIGVSGWTSDTPNGPGAIWIDGSSTNNEIFEMKFPPGKSHICNMIIDLTDDSGTEAYDGANTIHNWTSCEKRPSQGVTVNANSAMQSIIAELNLD